MKVLDKTIDLEQEQAEAIIQIQMRSNMLDGFLVMGKHCDSDRNEDDYMEVGSEELEMVCDGEYTILQLWTREGEDDKR